MTAPYWDDNPIAWDAPILNGERMPGVWKIRLPVERILDIKHAPGNDGARITDKGYKLAPLDMEVQIADAETWKRIQGFIDKYHPKKKGGVREPISISHPETDVLKISKIYIHKIGPMTIDNGIMEMTLHAVEWVDTPKKVKKKAPKTVDTSIPTPLNRDKITTLPGDEFASFEPEDIASGLSP